ncbi:hypothetical protein ACFXTH_026934 [Malus domestica]
MDEGVRGLPLRTEGREGGPLPDSVGCCYSKIWLLVEGKMVYLFVCSHVQNYIFRTKLTYNVYLSMDLHHLRIECTNGSWWNKLMMLSRSELDWGWYFMFIALFGACGSFHLLRIIGLSFIF